MKRYVLEFSLVLEDGMTEGQIENRLYGNLKHSELSWSADLIRIEDCDEEEY